MKEESSLPGTRHPGVAGAYVSGQMKMREGQSGAPERTLVIGPVSPGAALGVDVCGKGVLAAWALLQT